MLALIIAPFLIALLVYTYKSASKYIELFNIKNKLLARIIFGILLFGGLLSIIIGFLLNEGNALKRIFTQIGYYWLGIILYLYIGIALSLLCRIIVWLFKKNNGYDLTIARKLTILFVCIFTTFMCTYGIVNAHKLRITNYEVVSEKDSNIDNLNIVLLADLHLGYNVGIKEMQDMVTKVNSLNPDVVIIAGDIFDNEYDAIEQPEEMIKIFRTLETKYGVYATYGNHDIKEKIIAGFTFEWTKEAKSKVSADERMNKFIEDAGFKFLYDSYDLIEDSIYIYGRPDAKKVNFYNKTRIDASDITKDLDKSKTIICVDHQPNELQELANAGVDLDLSGHTHNGQFWPGTISINWFWKNAYGLKQIDNMTSIVTSGVGLFGFNMRTGCFPEIVNINLVFKK